MSSEGQGKAGEKLKGTWRRLKGAPRARLRIGLVVLVALVVGVAVLLAGDDSEDSGSAGQVTPTPAHILSAQELQDFAAAASHPIYWAGPLPGSELELREEANGRTLVRYLEQGAKVGSDPAGTLTIGTYPAPDPVAEVEGAAQNEGAIVRKAKDGTELVSNKAKPTSVYFADPEGGVQIEVYDPDPARAMRLAELGIVRPVG